MEIWKDIPSYKGLYQVSNKGNVKSLKRKGRLKDHILKPGIVAKGYYNVVLSKNKQKSQKYVHVLVVCAFMNDKPDGRKTIIDHIDNNKLNNNLSNLQLTTQRINTSKDRFRFNYSSKYVGVCKRTYGKKWQASIWIKDRRKHLGCFNLEINAHKAYQNALNNLSQI